MQHSQEGFTHALTEDEWKELYDEVKKQSIVGVCFAGIEGLPKEQLPPRELIMNGTDMQNASAYSM